MSESSSSGTSATEESQQIIKEESMSERLQNQDEDSQSQSSTSASAIKLSAQFSSFVSLRSAIDKYQRQNYVQLIVKDSKLLSSESTKKIIPKVYHLVNQKLMYHSITYCCKCHGELKQKSGSRIKNVGAKRLSCPMYMRFKLSSDLQYLVLFDILEAHNHSTDLNTFQMSPRQQVYRLSAINKGKPDPGDTRQESAKAPRSADVDVQTLIATAIKDVNTISSLGEIDYEPPAKAARIPEHIQNSEPSSTGQARRNVRFRDGSSDSDSSCNDEVIYRDNPNSPLDPDSSSCSDSEDEEFREIRNFLPLPMRLIGSAIQSHPELISSSKELIESQKALLVAQRNTIILKNKCLELKNAKLAMEVKNLEKNQATSASDEATTFYLQS